MVADQCEVCCLLLSRIDTRCVGVTSVLSVLWGGETLTVRPPRWPSGKASASRAEGSGFEFRLRLDFLGVESYQ